MRDEQTSEHTCLQLQGTAFLPSGCQPLLEVRVPASILPSPCPWFPQHLNLQAWSHFRIPKSTPTVALSISTILVTLSRGFNRKCPFLIWFCDPVICTMCSAASLKPEEAQQFGWLPSAFCCLYTDLATAWSKPHSPAKYSMQKLPWFWRFSWWEPDDNKKCNYRHNFTYTGGGSF